MNEPKKSDTDPAPPGELEPFNPEQTEHTEGNVRRLPNAVQYARVELDPKAAKLIPWMTARTVQLRRIRARGDYAGVEVLQMGIEPTKEFEDGQKPVALERIVEPDQDHMQLAFSQGVLRVGQKFVMELRNAGDVKRVFWVRPIGFGDHLDADEPWKQ